MQGVQVRIFRQSEWASFSSFKTVSKDGSGLSDGLSERCWLRNASCLIRDDEQRLLHGVGADELLDDGGGVSSGLGVKA